MKNRIASYIRVSTDEQAQVVEGSLDTQKHRLKSFIDMRNTQEPGWGRIVEQYVDDGFSAGDTKRPAYQKLMRDIASGKIDMILVTDLSRLSRNILDFCLLLEYLKKYSAKFLSIKDQFDTSTPVGEMMIFNMINLAQFERRQVSERVSQNFHARAQRGLRSGAPPILGYDIDPENKSTLTVNKSEATSVQKIFEIFIEEGSSGKTIRRLNDLRIKPKTNIARENRAANHGIWTRQSLISLLTNLNYVGLREVNKKNRNLDQEKLKSFERHQIVKAAWPAIIDKDTFDRAQEAIETSHLAQSQRLANKETRVFFASSILKCPECEAPFFGAASHGKRQVHRYYSHRKLAGVRIDCKVKRMPAESLEQDILKYVEIVLRRDGYLQGIEMNIEKVTYEKISSYVDRLKVLKGEEASLNRAIGKTFELHRSTPSADGGFGLIRQELARLSEEKKSVSREIQELETFIESQPAPRQIRRRIEDGMVEFQNLWKKSTGSQKKRLLATLFETIYIFAGELGVMFNGASADGEMIQGPQTKKALGSFPKAGASNLFSLSDYRSSAGAPIRGKAVENACVDKFGRGDVIRTRDLLLPKQARYQAALRPDSDGKSPFLTDALARCLANLSVEETLR